MCREDLIELGSIIGKLNGDNHSDVAQRQSGGLLNLRSGYRNSPSELTFP